MKTETSYDTFAALEISTGTVLAVEDNVRAKKPAYILTIDFGPHGIKKSSAQITRNYKKDALIGTQVVAVLNFPTKNIAGVISECLVLGSCSGTKDVVLLRPTISVENGAPVG